MWTGGGRRLQSPAATFREVEEKEAEEPLVPTVVRAEKGEEPQGEESERPLPLHQPNYILHPLVILPQQSAVPRTS